MIIAPAWTEKEDTELIALSTQVPKLTLVEIAKATGKTEGAIKSRRFKLRQKGKLKEEKTNADVNVVVGSDEESATGRKIVLEDLTERVKTLDDLIRVCEIDIELWEVKSWKCKAYGGFIKNQNKRPEKVQLFSVSASLDRKKGVDFKAEITKMIDEAKIHAPILTRYIHIPAVIGSGNMLELSIPDLHIGKLAWGPECGTPYDSKIAAELYRNAVGEILHKTSGYQFEEINLIVGNDFLNVDNSENMTTRGTPQTCDTRHQKMFSTGRKLIQEVVEEQLRGRAQKVNIVIVPGNHDQQTVWALGEVLDAWFHRCEDVAVDNRPTLRKYIQFGQVLLGFTHGDKEKHERLPLIMAQEQKHMWADTSFREWHVGHLHQRNALKFRDLQEDLGVVVRILPSLCAPEDWHVGKGFVGNIRSAEAYMWNKETGLIGTAIYNAPLQEAA